MADVGAAAVIIGKVIRVEAEPGLVTRGSRSGTLACFGAACVGVVWLSVLAWFCVWFVWFFVGFLWLCVWFGMVLVCSLCCFFFCVCVVSDGFVCVCVVCDGSLSVFQCGS